LAARISTTNTAADGDPYKKNYSTVANILLFPIRRVLHSGGGTVTPTDTGMLSSWEELLKVVVMVSQTHYANEQVAEAICSRLHVSAETLLLDMSNRCE